MDCWYKEPKVFIFECGRLLLTGLESQLEHDKQNFMGPPSRNMENGSVKSNAQVKRFQRETILGAGLDPLPL